MADARIASGGVLHDSTEIQTMRPSLMVAPRGSRLRQAQPRRSPALRLEAVLRMSGLRKRSTFCRWNLSREWERSASVRLRL